MKISYKTHNSVEITPQKISVIGTNSPVVYTDLVNGLQCKNEMVEMFDDEFNSIEISRKIDWIGDVGTQELVIQKYLTKIEKVFINSVTDEKQNQIHDQMNQLFNLVSEQLFMLDLPIGVNYDFDFKRLFKYCGIRFDALISSNPYGIIESILKIHEECSIDSCVVLTNIAHYLTPMQFKELSELVKQTNQSVLLIEFTEIGLQESYQNCDLYYIDSDFVDWHQ